MSGHCPEALPLETAGRRSRSRRVAHHAPYDDPRLPRRVLQLPVRSHQLPHCINNNPQLEIADIGLHMDEVGADDFVSTSFQEKNYVDDLAAAVSDNDFDYDAPSASAATTLNAASISTNNGEENSNCCEICYDELETCGDHRIVILPCGHLFGEKCIRKWITDHKDCPNCRKPRSLKDIIFVYNGNIRAIDTSKLHEAEKKVKTAEEEKRKTELEIIRERDENRRLKAEMDQLQKELEQQRLRQLLMASSSLCTSTLLTEQPLLQFKEFTDVQNARMLVSGFCEYIRNGSSQHRVGLDCTGFVSCMKQLLFIDQCDARRRDAINMNHQKDVTDMCFGVLLSQTVVIVASGESYFSVFNCNNRRLMQKYSISASADIHASLSLAPINSLDIFSIATDNSEFVYAGCRHSSVHCFDLRIPLIYTSVFMLRGPFVSPLHSIFVVQNVSDSFEHYGIFVASYEEAGVWLRVPCLNVLGKFSYIYCSLRFIPESEYAAVERWSGPRVYYNNSPVFNDGGTTWTKGTLNCMQIDSRAGWGVISYRSRPNCQSSLCVFNARAALAAIAKCRNHAVGSTGAQSTLSVNVPVVVLQGHSGSNKVCKDVCLVVNTSRQVAAEECLVCKFSSILDCNVSHRSSTISSLRIATIDNVPNAPGIVVYDLKTKMMCCKVRVLGVQPITSLSFSLLNQNPVFGDELSQGGNRASDAQVGLLHALTPTGINTFEIIK